MDLNLDIGVFIFLTFLLISYTIYCCTAPRQTELLYIPTAVTTVTSNTFQTSSAAPAFGSTILLKRPSGPPGYQTIVFPATYNPQNNYTLPLLMPISTAQSTSAVISVGTEPPTYEMAVWGGGRSSGIGQPFAIGGAREFYRQGSNTPRFSF